MTRYFVNYIDSDEVRALRETEHERPIGKYEDGEEIMSHLGTVVQQYVGLLLSRHRMLLMTLQ